jgi:predicted dinucleotide-binding enzyme
MKIAIIGAGHVGSALAKGLSRAGHTILLGVRKPDSPALQNVVRNNQNMSAHPINEAAENAEVLIIATPPTAILTLAPKLGEVNSKTIIDATNSVYDKPSPYQNGSEALRKLTGCGNVVKCFNCTGFENMENPRYGETGIDMFTAGNSQQGKQVASQLARDIGFAECYDFGGDDKIPLLEQLAMAWINLAIVQKTGRGIAFKILKR